MNKTAIKNFSIKARNDLRQEITQKAYVLGIIKDKIKDIETFEGGFKIKGIENSRTFKKYEKKQREKLISEIKEKGFDQTIEEVAYTWFNRFIALRFMEVNEYLPIGVRVLSSIEEGKTEPDIIKEALNVDLDIDRELVYKLIDANDTEDLYKYLLIKQCNELGKIMPMVFEEISDYTELLLPNRLLGDDSIIKNLVESIEEEDYKDQVEIIGWMYQYYISEKKDEVFANLKKNKKIAKENIPAATQLFTPKWIVKYMVENSLGRLWLESHPDEELKAQWKYYLEEAEQDPEVQKKLDELKDPNLNPEDIKILDPSMGSGHILVYAFDVLYDIYLKANYSERDIPKLILEKNLHGLDIDDRAGQLAAFVLMMKARSKNRRVFRRKINLNICSIQESNGITTEALEFFANGDEKIIGDIQYLAEVFHDAKEYGSILDVKKIDFDAIGGRLEEIREGATADLFELQYREILLEKLPSLIKQGKIMSEKYDVVCTNPPYMGRKGMNEKLSRYVDDNFKNSKSDLFAVFMDLDDIYLKSNGYSAMINQHSWMFLSSFENLRKKIINNRMIYNMLHLGSRAFEEIGGEVVQTTTFIERKTQLDNFMGTYIRLCDYNNAKDKEIEALNAITNKNKSIYYKFCASNFSRIPGGVFGYWLNDKILSLFNSELLGNSIPVKEGLNTGNNDKFLRLWFEINHDKFQYPNKWVPCNKGGGYRKWYGFNEYAINWENDGFEVKNYPNSVMRNVGFYLKEGITWSGLSTAGFSGRYFPKDFIFNSAGRSLFPNLNMMNYVLGLLNSIVADYIFKVIAPTLSFTVGNVQNIPIQKTDNENVDKINSLVSNAIEISKTDWDSFETSWDFKQHPLLTYSALLNNCDSNKIETAFNKWLDYTTKQFAQLKSNEEELNRIFIDIYGLQEELTSEVEDKDITITKVVEKKSDEDKKNPYVTDRKGVIKSFISYAVGCMFGRYSLNEEGLAYAGGEFDLDRYKTFTSTKDNVLVIADNDYFEDDILSRFVEFVRITFGEETLEENLDYIAETLGRKSSETSRQTIRRYFLKDFYKDHVKTYQKRPIYWLFDSGKKNGFKALIYMHRYNSSTIARVRTDYLHKLQRMYEAEVKRLDILLESDLSAREKAAARKQKENINKQIQECLTYDQVIAHIANQKIEIDLDDGVKVNYAKFQGVQIPQGDGKKPLKANLLAKI